MSREWGQFCFIHLSSRAFLSLSNTSALWRVPAGTGVTALLAGAVSSTSLSRMMFLGVLID